MKIEVRDVAFLKDGREIKVRRVVKGGFISRRGLFVGEEMIDWLYKECKRNF